ncbi:ABC transporter substrate-binding protein [bacterium]|nr:ABC transporter substrate-binding protein [bacterium]
MSWGNHHRTIYAAVKRLLAISTLLLCVIACAPEQRQPSEPETAKTPSKQPERIVSLTPSLTETVCDLGLTSALVAITANDDYPPEILKLPKVGDMNPDYEYIVSLHPDAVLTEASITSPGTKQRLEQLGLPIIEVRIEYLRDLCQQLPTLGALLHCPVQAQSLQNEIASAIAKAQQRANNLPRHPKVYLEVYSNPLMTAGKPSLLNELLEIAGGCNVYGDMQKPYPTVSAEDLIIRSPDIVLLTSMSSDEAHQHPLLSRLDAVKQNRILEMPPSLMQRPTKRSLQSIGMMLDYFEAWAQKAEREQS